MDSRLFQILYILLERGSITAKELAEKFEVSPRTIYRDVDALSGSGIPVYAMQGKGGGIFINEDFALNRSVLSKEEQLQILTAVQGLSILPSIFDDNLLTKLGGLFQHRQTDWLEIDFSDWGQKNQEVFVNIREAIIHKKRLYILYLSQKAVDSERTVEPLKLVFKQNAWYLYGYCLKKEANRIFKLSRIRKVQILDEYFSRKYEGKIFDSKESFALPETLITLKFKKEQLSQVKENYQNYTQLSDGSLLVKEKYPISEGFYALLLSLGANVEVVEPLDIREELIKRIQSMGNNY
ncbi:helix-turn-helix transcriptional regulator [Enterococcus sp. AZ103]|uniref:helix-turn-helix transcriptional regulator n=1 Tax=Enterococcus sp. AZ103 TaxID=2774628 RepID=UPI003F235D39